MTTVRQIQPKNRLTPRSGKRASFVLLLLTALTGCAPRLSSQAQAVRVVDDRALLAQCSYLGPVYGEERWIGGVLLAGQAEANALARLQQGTAELGGNAVAVANTDTGLGGSQVLGEAYLCAAEGAG